MARLSKKDDRLHFVLWQDIAGDWHMHHRAGWNRWQARNFSRDALPDNTRRRWVTSLATNPLSAASGNAAVKNNGGVK